MKFIIFTHCCRLQCRFDGKNDAWHQTSEASNNQVNNFIQLFFSRKTTGKPGKMCKTSSIHVRNDHMQHCMAVAVQLLLSLASLKHEQTALTNSLAQIPKLFFFFYICAFYYHSYTSAFSLSLSVIIWFFVRSFISYVRSVGYRMLVHAPCKYAHTKNAVSRKLRIANTYIPAIKIHLWLDDLYIRKRVYKYRRRVWAQGAFVRLHRFIRFLGNRFCFHLHSCN